MNFINSIQDLDQIAELCCFSQQHQKKSQAEEIILAFSKELADKPEKLNTILQGNSAETTLFVLAQYIYRQLKNMTPERIKQILDIILHPFKDWYDPKTGNFIRNGQNMQNHTINSIFRFIGQAVKALIKTQSHKDGSLLDKFTFKNSFQILFWKNIVNTVGNIDTSLGFLTFRNIIYFFQDNGIPIAIKVVQPYFKNLTESIRMNQLAVLQQNLSVEDTKPSSQQNSRILCFSQEQIVIATSAIQLIQQVLQYPFSITYGQYDMDLAYQHSVIYFPDVVSHRILEGDFYQSMFFLTERFIIQNPEHPLLLTCIDCLKQIILARVTFCQKTQRKKFTSDSLKGITRLMRILKDTRIGMDIIQFNIKMLGNIHLRKFRKLPQFVEWLSLIEVHLHRNLLSKPFRYHDTDYNDCFNLIQKLATGFKNQKLSEYRRSFQVMIERLFSEMMVKLFNQPEPLTEEMAIDKVKQLKAAASQFFLNIKQLILWNYEKNIGIILKLQQGIFQKVVNNEVININSLINLNFLVTEITHNCMVSQGYPYSEFTINAVDSLKKIIQNQMKYIIEHYQHIGARYQNNTLNTSTLIYVQTLLAEFCSNISATSPSDSSSNQELYNLFNESKIFKLVGLPQENNEKFLNDHILILMTHLQSGDQKQIIYTLEVMNNCIMKLKWSIKRVFFKKMPIIKNILKFCLQTSINNFKDKSLLKCRTEMTRLITILAFDDCLDSFKDRLDQVFASLDKSNILTLIYDIRGMAQQIDTSSIYRYFLKKATPYLISILEAVCANHLNNQQILKQSIKLNQKFLFNYLQRINSSGKSATYIYELVISCIPYWQIILNFLEGQIINDPDRVVSPTTHLIQCLNKILDGHYVNFSVLQAFSDKIDLYIRSFMRFLNGIFRSPLYRYPKTKKAIIICCKWIFQILNEYIYGIVDEDNSAINEYSRLYSYCLQMLLEEFNETVSGNQKSNEFGFVVDFLSQGLNYQFNAFLQTHQSHQHGRATLFKENMRQKILQMFITLIKVSTASNTKKVNLDKLTKFLGGIIKVYPENAKQIVEKLEESYPNSKMQLFMDFCQSCISQEKPTWYQKMNAWRESLKVKQEAEIVIQ